MKRWISAVLAIFTLQYTLLSILTDERALASESGMTSFTDTQDHWAEPAIQFVAAEGIMNGYQDETFKPNEQMTRVQLISVLARTFEWQANTTAPFSDIQSYAQSTQQEIAAAYEVGVVKGANGNLKPTQPVTRAQLALMLLRANEYEVEQVYVPKVVAPFTDITGYDAETQRAITFLYEYKLAQGISEKIFAPASPLTRAQAAKILTNLFEE